MSALQRLLLHLDVSTPQEPQQHLDIPGQQEHVLLLEVSTPQGPELLLDVTILQRNVFHMDLSGQKEPGLHLEVSGKQEPVLVWALLRHRGLNYTWMCLENRSLCLSGHYYLTGA